MVSGTRLRAEGDKVIGWLVSRFDRQRGKCCLSAVWFRQDGIMEAVEKQYLKTCVFAIYLVSPA